MEKWNWRLKIQLQTKLNISYRYTSVYAAHHISVENNARTGCHRHNRQTYRACPPRPNPYQPGEWDNIMCGHWTPRCSPPRACWVQVWGKCSAPQGRTSGYTMMENEWRREGTGGLGWGNPIYVRPSSPPGIENRRADLGRALHCQRGWAWGTVIEGWCLPPILHQD